MNIFCVVFILLFVLVNGQNPPRPMISEVFVAQVDIQVDTQFDQHYFGNGVWASNQPEGTAVEHFLFPERYITEYNLQRYDLGFVYHVVNLTFCSRDPVQGKLPPYWAWLMDASYKGQQLIRHGLYEVWEYTRGYATLGVAVTIEDPNLPAWFWRYSPQRNTTAFFASFLLSTPSPFYFQVPAECANVTFSSKVNAPLQGSNKMKLSVGCTGRSEILGRAESWLNKHDSFEGYRADSSGFVSMAWGLDAPGLTTQTLSQVSRKISKDELKEGDILLNAEEHVVIFGGWANSAKTQYIGFEHTQQGTVKSTIPYPYWFSTAYFAPYRYKSAC